MTSPLNPNEKLQIAFLILVTLLILSVFFLTPALRPVTLLTLLNVLILNPAVGFLNRRRVHRVAAILILYAFLSLFSVFGLSRLFLVLEQQWSSLIDFIPTLGTQGLNQLSAIESKLHDFLGVELNIGFRNWFIHSAEHLRSWALTHLPSVIGSLASAALLVPVFSFFILKDGKLYTSLYLGLIPKRYSKSAESVLQKIFVSLGIFVRAKLFEAFLFGLMMYLALILIKAPYAGIFAVIGGVSNIIPYLGPFIGAAPPLMLFGFSESLQPLFWPAVIALILINLIDNLLIFPVFVAKIVNLSPLTLLVSVAVGQELFGVVGMLLAVPIASILKIILVELRSLIYE